MNKVIKYSLITIICLIGLLIFMPSQSVFAATDTPTNGKIYNIYNKASGKCLNVNLGTNADGTNVIQWTKDGSLEQRFKVESYSSGYRLRAMCSSNGAGRVVDVFKVNGVIKSGSNVDIWAVPDDVAQIWTLEKKGDYYLIRLKSNTNLVLTSIGTANGSGAGNGATSAGNVVVQTYSSTNNNQLWSFRETNATCCWYDFYEVNSTFNTDLNNYGSKMGYKAVSVKNKAFNDIISSISNSDIYIYNGHGNPGRLYGSRTR